MLISSTFFFVLCGPVSDLIILGLLALMVGREIVPAAACAADRASVARSLPLELDTDSFVLYARNMSDHTSVLDKPITRIIGKANIGNRLNAAELRTTIHDSGIAILAIEMAKTGRRPTSYDEESGKFTWEDMSEAAHIDMIKFIVKKVLPDAKEIATVDQKSLDHWAAVIAAEAQPVEG